MQGSAKYQIVGLNYVSMYLNDFSEARDWYSALFGEPQQVNEQIYGWQMGDTWLTLIHAKLGTHPASNPRNAEYAIQVADPAMVDRLYEDMLMAGATKCMPPEDTEMYDPMRFAAVDDPFGMRIDIYCPLLPAP